MRKCLAKIFSKYIGSGLFGREKRRFRRSRPKHTKKGLAPQDWSDIVYLHSSLKNYYASKYNHETKTT